MPLPVSYLPGITKPGKSMSYSIYDAAIPPLVHMLGSLSSILEKGQAHGGIDPAEARLAADMLRLKNQVYIATDGAKGCGARLAGVEIPKYEDTETTFPELKARVAKTIAFLKSLDRNAFDGAEKRQVTLKFGPKTFEFDGAGYVGNFVLPNVYFHIATAYGILRNRGVVLGKADYLGG